MICSIYSLSWKIGIGVFILVASLYWTDVQAGLVIVPNSDGSTTITIVICDSSYVSSAFDGAENVAGITIIPGDDEPCDKEIPEVYRIVGHGVPVLDGTYTHTRYILEVINDTPVVDETIQDSDTQGLVPAGRDGSFGADGYGSCEFVQTVNYVIQFLIKMTGIMAIIVFLYAGYVMVISRGDSAMIEQAKKLFANVLIGFVIMLTAFLIINTILSILVGGASGILNWQTIECQYAEESAPATEVSVELRKWKGLTIEEVDAIVSTYDPSLLKASAGVCESSNIQKIWGSLARSANCIITEESACGALPISRSDIGADGNPFSFGVMQINTTVHVVRGCQSLGIPDLRCLDAWSGKDYGARVKNPSLYNACRKALLNPECNMINGKRIYKEAGNRWRPWSTAKQCGLR